MDVLMPQLGETVAEGKITKWFKSAGEAVKPGDNLFEIETDKVSMEVPSTTAGVLSEISRRGGRRGTGRRHCRGDRRWGGRSGRRSAKAQVSAARPRESGGPEPGPITHGDTDCWIPACAGMSGPKYRSTPSSKCARRNAISVRRDCPAVSPSRRWRAGLPPSAASISPACAVPARMGASSRTDIGDAPQVAPLASRSEGPTAADIKALYAPGSYEEIPLDGMRRTIAARLTQAKTVPHFYLTADVEIGRLIALREEANAGAPKDADGNPLFKLSLNDFVIRALALALARLPAANAVWAGDRILRFKHADIGVAVALDDGLVAPVLRAADAKSLSAISAEMKDLSARARDKKLAPADYQGGSSAISNLGMYGVREFSAIINPPHATILAVGAARRQAVEKEDGGVAFASMLSVTLSCDHRVVDGALGAKLLAAFKAFVEMPVSMLV